MYLEMERKRKFCFVQTAAIRTSKNGFNDFIVLLSMSRQKRKINGKYNKTRTWEKAIVACLPI